MEVLAVVPVIAELWTDDGGNLYYRMDNWHGFYAVMVNDYGRHFPSDPPGGQVKRVPKGAILKMRDGAWV